MDEEAEQKLSGYRARFLSAPVGQWTTARGTFDVLTNETIIFAADHTGTISYNGALKGETETAFEWREKLPFVIEVRYVDDADASEEVDDEEWDAIVYGFKLIEHDAGSDVVMHEVGQEGFWDVLAALRFVK
jgi:hypothetical protein